MASGEITGHTRAELAEMQEDWLERHPDVPFDEQYCLAEIGKQPEDYDGPTRYCCYQETYETPTGKWRCPFHGGDREYNGRSAEELAETKLAPMKHGMHATREHLVDDFDEKDEALYDWITESYTEAYDIDVENDPASAYDLHRLACEIVRAERGRGFLLDEGEVVEQEVRNEEGHVIIDEDGEIVTEKSEHYLAKMMHRQDKKITKLEKELAITRKEQQKQESTDEAVDAIKGFTELGASFLQREDKDYDPDKAPWESEDDG
jgi:hypothetical protein